MKKSKEPYYYDNMQKLLSGKANLPCVIFRKDCLNNEKYMINVL